MNVKQHKRKETSEGARDPSSPSLPERIKIEKLQLRGKGRMKELEALCHPLCPREK